MFNDNGYCRNGTYRVARNKRRTKRFDKTINFYRFELHSILWFFKTVRHSAKLERSVVR